ncbi:MAG: hypothetical protein GF405_07070 [Candidatus Eisenbacteria bacterium]|nr:hypothetical protein [Candidatus Eisenbacteria bacterium]
MAELRWTAWPAGRSPVRAIIAVAFLGLLGWTIQSLFRTPYFTIVALLLVWGQVAGFFLPTRYLLDDEGVRVKGVLATTEKSWSEFRSYYVDRTGLLLSPFLERSRLERFRGTSLQFHGNRDEVVTFVERAMTRTEETDERVEDAEPDEDGGTGTHGT